MLGDKISPIKGLARKNFCSSDTSHIDIRIHFFCISRIVIAIAYILIGEMPAWADTPTKEQSLPLQKNNIDTSLAITNQTIKSLDRIEVKGDTKNDFHSSSIAAKLVIKHDSLVRYGDTTLVDVLKRIPSVTVRTSQGHAAEISMYGLGEGYTQILLNGDPIPQGFSIESLAPDLIEHIEIMKVGTVDRSTQSIAGTINIVLKKSTQQGLRNIKISTSQSNSRPSINLNGDISDRNERFGYGLTTSLGIEKSNDDTALGYKKSARDSDGNASYDASQHGNETSQTIALAPRLDLSPGSNNSIKLDSFIRKKHYESLFYEGVSNIRGELPAYLTDVLKYQSEILNFRMKLKWLIKGNDGSSFDTNLGLNANKNESTAIFKGYGENQVSLLDQIVNSTASDNSINLNSKYSKSLNEKHVLTLGWDSEIVQRREKRTQHEITPPWLNPINLDESYNTQVRRIATFAQDEWEISDHWSAYLGLRWEELDTRSTGNVVTELSNRNNVWSPVLQSLWRLSGQNDEKLRVSLARTYKTPSTIDLTPRRYVATNNSATNPDTQGNPDLKPELSWGLNISYERRIIDDGYFQISAYMRKINDVIVDELYQANNNWISRKVNQGIADVRGLDFEIKGNLRTILKDAPSLDLHANLNKNWSSVRAVPYTENRLGLQPSLSANMGVDFSFTEIPVTVGGNFNYVGSTRLRKTKAQSFYVSPSRNLDLYALWKPTKHTQIRFSITNLLKQNELSFSRYFDTEQFIDQSKTSPTYMKFGVSFEEKF